MEDRKNSVQAFAEDNKAACIKAIQDMPEGVFVGAGLTIQCSFTGEEPVIVVNSNPPGPPPGKP